MRLLSLSIILTGLMVPIARSQAAQGWNVVNLKVSALTTIEGSFIQANPPAPPSRTTITRAAEQGAIIEVTGAFSFVGSTATVPEIKGDSVLITGRVGSAGGGPPVALADIKLSGISTDGVATKSWSFQPIAVGINGPRGCNPYFFVDSGVGFGLNQSGSSGTTVGFNVSAGKVLTITGNSVPLCLSFPAPENRQQMRLEFSGAIISIP